MWFSELSGGGGRHGVADLLHDRPHLRCPPAAFVVSEETPGVQPAVDLRAELRQVARPSAGSQAGDILVALGCLCEDGTQDVGAQHLHDGFRVGSAGRIARGLIDSSRASSAPTVAPASGRPECLPVPTPSPPGCASAGLAGTSSTDLALRHVRLGS